MNILDGKIKPFFSTLMFFFVLFAKISADMSYFNTKKRVLAQRFAIQSTDIHRHCGDYCLFSAT